MEAESSASASSSNCLRGWARLGSISEMGGNGFPLLLNGVFSATGKLQALPRPPRCHSDSPLSWKTGGQGCAPPGLSFAAQLLGQGIAPATLSRRRNTDGLPAGRGQAADVA